MHLKRLEKKLSEPSMKQRILGMVKADAKPLKERFFKFLQDKGPTILRTVAGAAVKRIPVVGEFSDALGLTKMITG